MLIDYLPVPEENALTVSTVPTNSCGPPTIPSSFTISFAEIDAFDLVQVAHVLDQDRASGYAFRRHRVS